MKLFPYSSSLSLVCTWLVATALYVLAGVAFQGDSFFFFLWVDPFVPINIHVALSAYAGFVELLYQPFSAPGLAYVFCAIPLLTLILILAADWAMKKIGIRPAPVKLLFNLAFLFILNVIVHMILFQTWKPWIIFITPPIISL